MSVKDPSSQMGKVVVATQVAGGGIDPRRARNIILLLAASLGLMMTGYGVVFPIFARRLGEFGSGVESLGVMTMAYALTSIIASPIMGVLADRYGRRPLILSSLAIFAIVNIGFLLAASTEAFILIRAAEGIVFAGLGPASMGVVADIAPENKRGQWMGYLAGGQSVGWVVGPTVGGVLYDWLGFAAPFVISAVLAFIAFAATFVMIPETRTWIIRQRETLRQRRTMAMHPESGQAESFWESLPRPLPTFAILLFINFAVIFAWTFAEPRLMFYVYDDLHWTTAQFGVAAGMYGIALLLGEVILGQLSDKYGRKPVLIAGVLLNSAQYLGFVLTASYPLLMMSFIIAGLAEALFSPALSAYYMDITPEQHRARIMGLRGAAGSVGSLVGPGLLVLAAGLISPQVIFVLSSAAVFIGAILTFLVAREPSRVDRKDIDAVWHVSRKRVMAAQATLRGVVSSAATARKGKKTNII